MLRAANTSVREHRDTHHDPEDCESKSSHLPLEQGSLRDPSVPSITWCLHFFPVLHPPDLATPFGAEAWQYLARLCPSLLFPIGQNQYSWFPEKLSLVEATETLCLWNSGSSFALVLNLRPLTLSVHLILYSRPYFPLKSLCRLHSVALAGGDFKLMQRKQVRTKIVARKVVLWHVRITATPSGGTWQLL